MIYPPLISIPLWVLIEVLDFGDISTLYTGLSRREQNIIAESFNIKVGRSTFTHQHPLQEWIWRLSTIRNKCAHHARLWDQPVWPDIAKTNVFTRGPVLYRFSSNQNKQIFTSLIMMSYMLRSIDSKFQSQWSTDISQCLNHFLSVVDTEGNRLIKREWMGIPRDWDPDQGFERWMGGFAG